MVILKHRRPLLFVIVVAGLVAALFGGRRAAAAPDGAAANAGWAEIGPGSATGGGISHTTQAFFPSLAMGPDGKPVVAWYNASSGISDIYVKQWDGSAWAELGSGSASGGGISHNPDSSLDPSLAIGSDGKPVVAWQDRSSGSSYEIYVRHWNGSAWAELAGSATGGGISDNAHDSVEPSLAIGSDGAPVVAWHDQSNGNNYQVYARRWNSAGWVEVGTGSAAGGGISHSNVDAMHPSLAISPNGDPVVAWNDGTNLTNKWDIYVRRYSPAPMPFKALIPAVFQP